MTGIRDGDLFERMLMTSVGPVDVLAEVVIDCMTIELHDIAVYPRGADRLTVPPAELMSLVRSVLNDLAHEGFDTLRVTGTRLSGSGPGRRLHLVVTLRKEEP